MKAVEIRALADAELLENIEAAREELFNLRFMKTRGQLADTNRVQAVKSDLARLLTIQRERELWAEYEAERSAVKEE